MINSNSESSSENEPEVIKQKIIIKEPESEKEFSEETLKKESEPEEKQIFSWFDQFQDCFENENPQQLIEEKKSGR